MAFYGRGLKEPTWPEYLDKHSHPRQECWNIQTDESENIYEVNGPTTGQQNDQVS